MFFFLTQAFRSILFCNIQKYHFALESWAKVQHMSWYRHTVNLPMRLAGFDVFQQFLQAKKVVFLDFNVIR